MLYRSISISIIANLISIVLAVIGLYLICRNGCLWKKGSINLIKARAFLNAEFLNKNWILIVIAVAFITIRRIYRFLELTYGFTKYPNIEVLFDITGFIVILVIVLMIYQWYKLTHAHPDY